MHTRSRQPKIAQIPDLFADYSFTFFRCLILASLSWPDMPEAPVGIVTPLSYCLCMTFGDMEEDGIEELARVASVEAF